MRKLNDSTQNQPPDEPIFHSPRTTRELERRQQDFFQFMSGDGPYFDPQDKEPETDPSLPIVKTGKLHK